MTTHKLKSVFLAEDDGDDCVLFSDALHEIDPAIVLTTLNDGMQLMKALNTPGNVAPDMIFFDLNMPRKGGLECLKEIKQSPALKNIPVVIISTSSNPISIDACYQNGANYYVTKPNSYPALLTALQEVINGCSDKVVTKKSIKEFYLTFKLFYTFLKA